MRNGFPEVSTTKSIPNHAAVRLTEEAHTALIEKALYDNVTIKTLASNIILASCKGEKELREEKELRRQVEALKEGIKYRQNILIFYSFVTGAAGSILGFIMGVMV